MHLASTVRLGSLRDRVGYLLAPGENERVRLIEVGAVSYTHLTLPTNREV